MPPLSRVLHELKRRGYHIVHVVPATPDRAKTATVPSQWMMHAHGRQFSPGSSSEIEDTTVLPAPSPTSFGTVQPFDARPALAASMHMFHPGQVNLKQQIIALDSRVTHLANELRRKVNKV